MPASPVAAARRRAPEPGTDGKVRPARAADVPALLAIEARCFPTDRLSRRSFHHLLTKAHAIALVVEHAGTVAGYAIVLLHGASALARLYSFAIAPDHRGLGLGPLLLAEAEARARADGRAVMRLEVRVDNAPAVRRYREAGYVEFGRIEDYYEDGAPALRMEKALAGGDRPELSRIPYYAQTLEFTCGPSALMMAMKALDPSVKLDRKLEIRLWRESTLVYMTSGHGGCDPFGLALAAHERGFGVKVFLTEAGPLFLDSVRSHDKKEVMRLVQEDFRAAVAEAGVAVERRGLSSRDLVRFTRKGEVPIVLISSYRLYGDKEPHWVVVTGHDERFVYMHDPFVDDAEHRNATDGVNVPVARAEFDRMARYGKARLRAAVILSRPGGG